MLNKMQARNFFYQHFTPLDSGHFYPVMWVTVIVTFPCTPRCILVKLCRYVCMLFNYLLLPVLNCYRCVSLSLPCFPDFRGKGGYTSAARWTTVLYPGPPSSSPRLPTPPLSCLSRCNRAISYVVFLSFSFPSPGEHICHPW